MKKKMGMFAILIVFLAESAMSQLQKGNVLMGADLANIGFNLNKGGNFSLGIQPKAAWFIRDNKAIGAYVNIQLTSAKGAGSTLAYGVGALGRYYFSDKDMQIVNHARFFLEGNFGIEGYNPATGDNTNGLGIGAGPGLAYFITPNIGLEGLLKYGTIVGFGSSASSSNLTFNFGFQIYLPRKTIRQVVNEVK
ncbi:MAG: hypothetical protein ABI415_08575 [Flavitalea sp.]